MPQVLSTEAQLAVMICSASLKGSGVVDSSTVHTSVFNECTQLVGSDMGKCMWLDMKI